ncbi:hypothetical protein LCGC14_0377200 [marine sediment metagenome]|uniref:Uncharacterized protein n=1 Tax=marine sediment metagenome TaxID=412755 RepID=A0A0F9T9J5_9ZZZZ
MACKHTIQTPVDEDGCCVSCGEDLNVIVFEQHCGKCPIIAANTDSEMQQSLLDLRAENEKLKVDIIALQTDLEMSRMKLD